MLRDKKIAPVVTMLALVAALAAGGCKKNPPPAASTPPPPPATRVEPAPEPVNVAPAKPVVEAPPPVRSTSVDELNRMGILKSIYFDFDRHEVRPDQRPTMEGNATAMKGQLAKYRILIEGHCDERGSNEYNMALGDKRTHAARQYLIDLGVPSSRIRTISYGEERPADPGHNEEGWARNRRCEFIIEE